MSENREERTWGMLCHLSAFAGFVIPWLGSLLGPLVVWLIKKDQFPFVDDQGKESLNFQITMLILSVVGVITVWIGVGFLLLVAVGVYDIVMVIIATVQTSNGERYRYPVTWRVVK